MATSGAALGSGGAPTSTASRLGLAGVAPAATSTSAAASAEASAATNGAPPTSTASSVASTGSAPGSTTSSAPGTSAPSTATLVWRQCSLAGTLNPALVQAHGEAAVMQLIKTRLDSLCSGSPDAGLTFRFLEQCFVSPNATKTGGTVTLRVRTYAGSTQSEIVQLGPPASREDEFEDRSFTAISVAGDVQQLVQSLGFRPSHELIRDGISYTINGNVHITISTLLTPTEPGSIDKGALLHPQHLFELVAYTASRHTKVVEQTLQQCAELLSPQVIFGTDSPGKVAPARR